MTDFYLLLLRLDWPVRALSFSYDGKMLASGSEDLYVDIADVTTGEKVNYYYYNYNINISSFTQFCHLILILCFFLR